MSTENNESKPSIPPSMVAMLTGIMPISLILEMLEDAISSYKIDPDSKDNMHKLGTAATVAALKMATLSKGGNEFEEAMKIGKKISGDEEWNKLNPKNNQS